MRILSSLSPANWTIAAMVYNTVKAYTDIELLSMIKSVSSLSQLIESLGLRPAGGNFIT